MPTKPAHLIRIVTCCYCGARSTLPGGRRREALVCHGCGAPVARIVALAPEFERARTRPGSGPRKPAIPHAAERPGAHLAKDRPARRRKGKRRRTIWWHIREAVDDLDDLFDVFD